MRGPYGIGPPGLRAAHVRPLRCRTAGHPDTAGPRVMRTSTIFCLSTASFPTPFFPYCSILGEYSGIGARLWMESAKTGGLPGLKKTSTCSQSHAGCGVQNSVNASFWLGNFIQASNSYQLKEIVPRNKVLKRPVLESARRVMSSKNSKATFSSAFGLSVRERTMLVIWVNSESVLRPEPVCSTPSPKVYVPVANCGRKDTPLGEIVGPASHCIGDEILSGGPAQVRSWLLL